MTRASEYMWHDHKTMGYAPSVPRITWVYTPLVGDHVVMRYAPGGHLVTTMGIEPTPTI